MTAVYRDYCMREYGLKNFFDFVFDERTIYYFKRVKTA